MANPKRASMREGPLAALFRKTEEGEEAPPAIEAAPAARERQPAPQSPPAHPPRDRPSTPGAARRGSPSPAGIPDSHAPGAPAPRLLI